MEYDILYNYVKFVCDKEGLNDCIFNIVLVDNDYIKRLNRDYRNIDKVTDVISFALEDSDNDYDSVIRVLGDIYISVDMAYYQAKSAAWGFYNTEEPSGPTFSAETPSPSPTDEWWMDDKAFELSEPQMQNPFEDK